jgi:hypothetical protein
MPEPTTEPQTPQRRKDPPSRPTQPEVVRAGLVSGRFLKEAGWVYQRIHRDDMMAQTYPRMLEPLGKMFGGWTPVRGDKNAFLYRRADDSTDETFVMDADTVWGCCREEEHALLLANEAMKHDNRVKLLRTDQIDEGQVTTVNKWRGPEGRPVLED